MTRDILVDPNPLVSFGDTVEFFESLFSNRDRIVKQT